jgi:hypothetical protein
MQFALLHLGFSLDRFRLDRFVHLGLISASRCCSTALCCPGTSVLSDVRFRLGFVTHHVLCGVKGSSLP